MHYSIVSGGSETRVERIPVRLCSCCVSVLAARTILAARLASHWLASITRKTLLTRSSKLTDPTGTIILSRPSCKRCDVYHCQCMHISFSCLLCSCNVLIAAGVYVACSCMLDAALQIQTIIIISNAVVLQRCVSVHVLCCTGAVL